MRKVLRVLGVVAAVLLTSATVWAGHETYQGFQVVHVIVNGKPLQSDVPAINFHGRTVLPVRAVVEAVNGSVTWDGTTSTATITTADTASIQANLNATEAELVRVKAELEAKVARTSPPAPGEPGSNRSSPAPIGTAVNVPIDDILTKATVKVTILETIRGAEAWKRIQAANMFNDEPEAGHEYLLVRAKVQLLEISDTNKSYGLSGFDFKVVSDAGRQYDNVSVVAPDPKIDSKLYVNASHEGWFAVMVATDDAAPLLAYGLKFDGSGGAWFRVK